MKRTNRYLVGVVIGGLTALSVPAHATNGYFAHGYGTKNSAMAGAGVALPQDTMAAATNPAGMVWVGDRSDFGVAVFNPNREYTPATPTGMTGYGGGAGLANGNGSTIESDNSLFLVPHYGRNWMQSPDSSFGIAVYGNGGMNTEYKASGTPGGFGTFGNGMSPAGDAGVDLMQLFVAPTYAKKQSSTFSWGVSAIVAYQRFSAKGLMNYGGLSTDNTKLTNNGSDDSFGYGARVGMLVQLSPSVNFGASYQTRVYMDEFDKYAGLFAEQGDFDVPPNATIGFAWKTSDSSTFVADLQWIGYGEVAAVANPISPNITNCMGAQTSYCLGGDNGIGFGWDDMTILKLGYQWQTSPEWIWRVGYSHGDQPIPSSELVFNIVAPAVIEDHITFGFTKRNGSNSEFNLSVMHALENSKSGNPTGEQSIELKMDQWQVEASWGWTF